MAHKTFDLAQQLTTSTGTGALTLGAVPSGRIGFADQGAVAADTFWGCIQHETADEVEVTLCTVVGDGTITRAATPLISTTGAKIAFSAGSKTISCVAPASKSVTANADGIFNFPLPVAAAGVREVVVPVTIAAGVVALDLFLGGVFTLPITANITSIDIQNETAGFGHSFTIEFTANGTGYSQVWPWTWIGGTPVLTTTNAKRDLAVVWSINGVTFFAAMVAQNY
jgi:hypothetical protein